MAENTPTDEWPTSWLPEMRKEIVAAQAVVITFVTGKQTHYVRITKSRALRIVREDPRSVAIRVYGKGNQRTVQLVVSYTMDPDSRINRYQEAMSWKAIS